MGGIVTKSEREVEKQEEEKTKMYDMSNIIRRKRRRDEAKEHNKNWLMPWVQMGTNGYKMGANGYMGGQIM